jgi:hypothetical protein
MLINDASLQLIVMQPFAKSRNATEFMCGEPWINFSSAIMRQPNQCILKIVAQLS